MSKPTVVTTKLMVRVKKDEGSNINPWVLIPKRWVLESELRQAGVG